MHTVRPVEAAQVTGWQRVSRRAAAANNPGKHLASRGTFASRMPTWYEPLVTTCAVCIFCIFVVSFPVSMRLLGLSELWWSLCVFGASPRLATFLASCGPFASLRLCESLSPVNLIGRNGTYGPGSDTIGCPVASNRR
jgi:hypothetical protein